MNWPADIDFDRPRRHRMVPISGTCVGQMLGLLHVHPKARFESDLPQGTRFVRWFLDPMRDSLMMVVEHESFAEVQPGAEVPLHLPMMVCIEREDPK